MSYQSTGARYLEADVLSRPREWLVPLLFEHLLAALHRADFQIECGDQEGKGVSLDKATQIVLELAGSLDHARGGSIAEELGALYTFFAGEILSIGRSLDRARLGRVIAMIGDLHEAWSEAAESVAPRTRASGRLPAAAVA